MKAGRELDELVAEKVMGMHKKIGNHGGMMGSRSGYFDAWIESNGERYGRDAPPFSTDIEAAWQVVEKVRNIEIDKDSLVKASFQVMASPYDPVYYAGWVAHDDANAFYHWNFADTAPYAICLAALAAKGVLV